MAAAGVAAVVWAERLARPGANRTTWASPVLANGCVYVTNQLGDTSVVRASPELALLAVNSIGEACNASLAVSEGEIFLRTHAALWCLRDVSKRKFQEKVEGPDPRLTGVGPATGMSRRTI